MLGVVCVCVCVSSIFAMAAAGGGFKVTFVGALSGNTLATVVVPPQQPLPLYFPGEEVDMQLPPFGQLLEGGLMRLPPFGQPLLHGFMQMPPGQPGQEEDVRQLPPRSDTPLPLRAASLTLIDVFKQAKLNPYKYRIVIDNKPLEPEEVNTYMMKGVIGETVDFEVQLIVMESMLEVQWFLSSETHFQGQAMQCPDVLPTIFVDNDGANVESIVSQLLLRIPEQYRNLMSIIKHDILVASSKVRKRKLDVAREYNYENSRWVIRCVLVVQTSGLMALRLTGNQFHMHDEAGVAANVDTIMREIDTIIV